MPIDSGLISIIAKQRADQAEKQDPFNLLMKGLNVASTVYGIKEAGEKSDALKLDMAAKQKAAADQAEYEAQLKDQNSLAGKVYGMEYQKRYGEPIPAGKTAYDLKNVFDPKKLNEIEAGAAVKFNNQKAIADINNAQQDKRDDKKFKNEKENIILKNKIDKANSGPDLGKTLPATEAQSMGDANASFDALEAASKAFSANTDITGPGTGKIAGLAGYLELGDQGKRAKVFDAQLKINAQTIGKYLEGGKLTDADIDRYKQMLPNLSDSEETAQQKTILLQNLLAKKQAAQKEALGQAGYNVQNVRTSVAPPTTPATTTAPIAPSPDVQEAARRELIKRKGLSSGIRK